VSHVETLPSQLIKRLIDMKIINHYNLVIDDKQIQPASLDLTISGYSFTRVRAGFLPGRFKSVEKCLKEFSMYNVGFDENDSAILERGGIYIFELNEYVKLPNFISGVTNPKSSIGRLDIFVRIITDNGTEFDKVPPGYTGSLYAEVSPRAFSVMIHAGDAITQLRFNVSSFDIQKDISSKSDKYDGELVRDLLPEVFDMSNNFRMQLDSSYVSVHLGIPYDIIGYKAVKNPPTVIDISVVNKYNLKDFWEPIYNDDKDYVVVLPDEFYIFASEEYIIVHPWYSAEMCAYNESLMSGRSHFAGYLDNNFGYADPAKIVLEMRVYDVPFIIRRNQIVSSIKYTSSIITPDKLYGKTIGSNYSGQGLRLGKQFIQE
jgi:dCTP deaminase